MTDISKTISREELRCMIQASPLVASRRHFRSSGVPMVALEETVAEEVLAEFDHEFQGERFEDRYSEDDVVTWLCRKTTAEPR